MSMRDVIKTLRIQAGLEQEDVAQAVGVSRSSVSHWERGATQPRHDKIIALAKLFGVHEQVFFDEADDDAGDTVQGSPAVAAAPDGLPLNDVRPLAEGAVFAAAPATVPLVTLGRVHAGAFSDTDLIGRSVEVKASLLEKHPHAQAVLVEGDCMSRVCPEGSIVIFDPDLEPSNGHIVIVETEDHQVLLRRWNRGTKTLMLSADSYAPYDDIVIEGDEPIRVIGQVIDVIVPNDML
ncbi:MAG: LexA family transcriptional regulator [Atopobiaceae bacterium]|nr:LexA family transcriptional regulator [Atopobiaceae bacterium]MDO4405080.1 XRE family transcriptional regulator [Atopobiaceae bacterium]